MVYLYVNIRTQYKYQPFTVGHAPQYYHLHSHKSDIASFYNIIQKL